MNRIKYGRFTKSDQKKAVNRTFSLVKKGNSITNARKIVAKEYNISDNTLWAWQSKLEMTTPTVIKTTNLIKDSKTSVHTMTRSGSNVIKGLETMKSKLGIVFESLVEQDGRFTNQDAAAISGTAGVILGCCKQVLLERKAITKVNKAKRLS